MSQWLEQALVRAEAIDDWLSPKRKQSLAQLRSTPWPSRKVEAWRFTPVRALEQADFGGVEAKAADVERIANLDSIDLVFSNGVFDAAQSASEWPEGLHVSTLGQVEGSDRELANELFASIKPERHVFGLVNDVLARDGVLIQVDEGAQIQQPLRIVHNVSAGADVHARVLVRIGAGARATVIEQTSGDEHSFNTSFAEYAVGDDAELEHYRFALQSDAAMAIGGSHFRLQNRSQLSSTMVGFGSQLSRLDADLLHCGEHAFAKLNAIYLLKGDELFDLHSNVEHIQPNGTTEENVRGIVADSARAVFNGRIHIHPHAQKTLAELNNRNLLLSNKATVNTKPELEIYADDVRCAHGATVAQIDTGALYYMQTRGIPAKQAQVMLNFGFINELVEQMPNAALAEWLRPQLSDRFAAMNVQDSK